MILPLLASLALADSITLDTGATLEGDLARYEFGGDCQLSVTEGDLSGVIVIVPCHRVQSFVRTSVRTPVPIGLTTESSRATAGRTAGAVEPGTHAVNVADTTGQGGWAVEVPVEDAPFAEEAVAADPAVSGPLAQPEGEAFYDEPLFPADATTPVVPGGGPVAEAPGARGVSPSQAAPQAPAAVPAPAPMETAGPRLAPRMDEAPPASRPVRF